MKLTKKEFKKFNRIYFLTQLISPSILCLISLIYLFGVVGTNYWLIALSYISILYYIIMMIINNINEKFVYVEIDKYDKEYNILNQYKKYNYTADNLSWLIFSLSVFFLLMIAMATINNISGKWSNNDNTNITINTDSITDIEYILSKEDSINIIELAKMAELECSYNFSDSLLKLEKSKPNRFEMQDIIQVIFNRVDSHHPSFKNTIYEVLRQDKQFQPYTSGKFDDYHCSNESIRIAKENYILWKTTGHSNSLLPKTVIGFCSAEYAESVNVVNVWNGWKRVEGKSLRVSANGMRLHYFYSIK